MQTVKVGDVYFLDSPFTSDSNPKLSKLLCYLLDTASSRPAVVMREPHAWDSFNTVTIIPAVSKAEIAIKIKLVDRFGGLISTDYPFTPHTPHSIPVSRLGRRIGTLDEDELAEITYAFNWIHNPAMQVDPNCEVPEIYREAIAAGIPLAGAVPRYRPYLVDINISKKMVLTSNAEPKLNGAVIDIVNPSTNKSYSKHAIVEEEAFYVTEDIDTRDIANSNLECADMTTNGDVAAIDEDPVHIVPIEKGHPCSYFSVESLDMIASRMTSYASYAGAKCEKRDVSLLTKEEKSKIIGRGKVDYYDTLEYDIFPKLSSFDVNVLCTNLPPNVIAKYLEITRAEAEMLNRLCITLRDIPSHAYRTRLERRANNED